MAAVHIYLGNVPANTGFTATAAQTLPRLSQSATATLTYSGVVAQTLPKLAQAATATVSGTGFDATIEQTLPRLAQSATATLTFTATATQTLPKLSQAAVAVLRYSATVAQTLPRLAQSITATLTFSGTIAQTLPKLTQAAVADVAGAGVSATIEQTLPSLQQAATATNTDPAGQSITIDYGESYYSLRRKRKKKVIKKVIHAIAEKVEAPTPEDIERALSDILISVDNVEKNTRYQESINALIRAEVERKQKEIERAHKQRQEQAAWLAEFTAEQHRLAAEEAAEQQRLAEFAELSAAVNKEYKKQRNKKRALMIAAMIDAL